MIVVGIDPGLAGAVASLDVDSQLRHLHDPLVMAIRVGRPRKKAMAAGTNVAAFGHVCPSHPRHHCREWGGPLYPDEDSAQCPRCGEAFSPMIQLGLIVAGFAKAGL